METVWPRMFIFLPYLLIPKCWQNSFMLQNSSFINAVCVIWIQICVIQSLFCCLSSWYHLYLHTQAAPLQSKYPDSTGGPEKKYVFTLTVCYRVDYF